MVVIFICIPVNTVNSCLYSCETVVFLLSTCQMLWLVVKEACECRVDYVFSKTGEGREGE